MISERQQLQHQRIKGIFEVKHHVVLLLHEGLIFIDPPAAAMADISPDWTDSPSEHRFG